ncbi:RNA polymerase sigma factor [Pleionea sediminis]|uniref:RNA polymerase sigma factor n=1 Tax=Pleionea sediminis TaxID=2569479 RepID=UPI00118570A9|nr:sigma-70 family RNA polymerase sigma factor [Pleionea sediminis]
MQQAEQDLLVLEAQSGNAQALECLIAVFHPLLVQFATSLSGNHALAKDAVQDVWLKIAKKLRQLNDPRAFRSWLYRAVRWRVSELMRGKAEQFERLDESVATTELDETEIENRALRRLVHQLADTEREVIYLHYLAELSVAEMALVLEIPAGTVKSRLSRARKQLQQMIDS